jgi:hypothetical protein
VLTEGITVRLIDLSGQSSDPTPGLTPGQSGSPTFGKTLWTVDLGPRRYLAGIGAYTPESGAQKTATGTWNDTGWTETGHVVLKALRPDGSTQTLLDPPDGVLTMDVARDLMEAGRFGGPSSSASIFPARSIIWIALVPLTLLVLVAAVVLVAVIRLVRRHRRRVRPGPSPGR